MKRVICTVVKYLMWALLIIVALLYMSGFDIRQQAMVILVGTVGIDLLFTVCLAVSDFIANRRKKASALQKAAEKAAEKAVGVKRGKKAGKGKETATPAVESVKETSQALRESVRETGTALKDAAESTWGVIKEKSSEVTAAIKEKISSADE